MLRWVWSLRLLRWLALATAVSAGTGVLLSVPPLSFFIYPVYPPIYVVHGWFSIAVAAPFAAGVLLHGVPAWRARGRSRMTWTGLLLAGAYLGSLGLALYSSRAPDPARWLLFVHMGVGMVALVLTFVHAPRFWLPVRERRRDETLEGGR